MKSGFILLITWKFLFLPNDIYGLTGPTLIILFQKRTLKKICASIDMLFDRTAYNQRLPFFLSGFSTSKECMMGMFGMVIISSNLLVNT